MKKLLLGILFATGSLSALAQIDSDVKFTQNDYFIFRVDSIIPLNDTLKLLTIHTPAGYSVYKEQGGVVYGNPILRNDTATAAIGTGRCRLVKGTTAVFSLKYKMGNRPRVGDLLYTPLYFPAAFKGRIYELTRKAIFLRTALGDSLYTLAGVVKLQQQGEEEILQKMVADIHFVAGEMKKQNNNQDQLITGGLFKGKRLFDAMEAVDAGQVREFLDYMIARPRIYVFNCWSISEVFATWMVSETPMVIKD